MDYSYEDIYARREEESNRVFLALKEGDSAVNPASTKRKLYGPLGVRYIFWPDGAIDATVFQP